MKKIKSIILFAIFFAAAVAILFSVAGPDENSEGSNQPDSVSLNIEERFFDFGRISMAAGAVTHEFKVKNTSDEGAIISQIYTSCMCTRASFKKGDVKMGPFGMPGHGFVPKINGIIGGGEEAVIEVTFDPAAHGPAGVGPVDRLVYLVQEGAGKPLELQFKAVVTP